MKVTLHGVVTTICLLGLVALIKSQGILIRDQNKFVKEAIDIPGVCIKPETATMVRDHRHNVIFRVKTCDGQVITISKNFGINI